MAPTDSSTKATPKVQRSVTKTITSKNKSSPANAHKKVISSAKKIKQTIPLRMNNTIIVTRQRTSTVPKVSTPKPKENKAALLPPGSITKSANPAWKRRPKPAHSGVPVPKKMEEMQRQFRELNDSL